MKHHGAIGAGHIETVRAAEEILRDGGNAFDAVIAAQFAACVVEPVLCSLGGGGYLIFRDSKGRHGVYDFFVQTPRQKPKLDELDFYPIQADFGTATQEFHIGRASIATPGTVRGMFEIHRDLASMPMSRLVEPAIRLAKNGINLNAFQAYILDIVKPIYQVSSETREIFTRQDEAARMKGEGDSYRMTGFADVLDALAHEGDALFYRGEIAAAICHVTREGGCLDSEDLKQYTVEKRRALQSAYGNHRLLTNPLPSSGGTLIHFALQLLHEVQIGQYRHGSYAYLRMLANVMDATSRARVMASQNPNGLASLLDPEQLKTFVKTLKGRAQALRGTTHISIVDAKGNAAAMTLSNGEGCGHMLPGMQIMLNNMLGEEDLNPQGFHHWQTDQRMTSMMAPSLLLDRDGGVTALGSGGSNRLRTAVLQTLINLVDFGMHLEEAVQLPRIHLEQDVLNIEGGLREDVVNALVDDFPQHVLWPEHNLFFGGVHAVRFDRTGLSAAGDPRRGGCTSLL
ncbi:MAG: gamma-glutamyltransferase [Gammaproteobacteria bacterium]|nr:gamma-glutamyltransferase [Gammaproteobacteria bacterium]